MTRSRVTSLAGLAIGALGLGLALAAPQLTRQPIPVPTVAVAVASSSPARLRPSPTASLAAASREYLVVIDFLPGIGDDVEVDPIEGNPDAAELELILGEPTAFGSAVVDRADAKSDAPSRCGVVPQRLVETAAGMLNERLPDEQRIDPSAAENRALLHWAAAEGFVSVRIFARAGVNPPSCADAGARF